MTENRGLQGEDGRTTRLPARRAAVLLATALGVLGFALIGTAATSTAAAPTADFTWKMQDRFGLDVQAPANVIDYRTDAAFINPSSWTVDLDACGTQSPTGLTYAWTFTKGTTTLTKTEAGKCTLAQAFPSLGSWNASLTVTDGGGGTATKTATLNLRDFVIVSMGDSAASGEGNPDWLQPNLTGSGFKQAGFSHTWNDVRCHRSALAGHAQAALRIEQRDPHSSVTFVHVACSGARITRGLLSTNQGIDPTEEGAHPERAELECDDPALLNYTYGTPEDPACLPPQVDQVKTILAGRPIDALLLSIGINDVQFSSVVKACLLTGNCKDDVSTSLPLGAKTPAGDQGPFVNGVDFLAPKFAKLPGLYDQLDQKVDEKLTFTSTGKIFATEYPNAAEDDAGNTCLANELADIGRWSPDVQNRLNAYLEGAGVAVINQNELAWAKGAITDKLGQEIAAAAGRNGWVHVKTRDSAGNDIFAKHGYCARNTYFRTIKYSLLYQRDPEGSFHPNRAGHFYGYALPLEAELVKPANLNITAPAKPADVPGDAELFEAIDQGLAPFMDVLSRVDFLAELQKLWPLEKPQTGSNAPPKSLADRIKEAADKIEDGLVNFVGAQTPALLEKFLNDPNFDSDVGNDGTFGPFTLDLSGEIVPHARASAYEVEVGISLKGMLPAGFELEQGVLRISNTTEPQPVELKARLFFRVDLSKTGKNRLYLPVGTDPALTVEVIQQRALPKTNPLKATYGLLEANLHGPAGGKGIDVRAALKIGLKDPNADGRITGDELATKPLVDLVSLTCDPTSFAKLDLTLAAGLTGLTGDLARLTLNDTNLCNGIDTPGFQVLEPKLPDFSTMKPADLVNVLISLIDALETLEERGDVQLPFLKEKLSHAVDLSKRLLAFLDEHDFIDPQKPLDQQPPLDQAKQDKIATFEKLAKLLVDYLEAQGISLPNGLNLRYDAAKRRLLLDLKLGGGPPGTTVQEDFDLAFLGRAGLVDVVATGQAEVRPTYSVDFTAGIDLIPDPPNAATSALKTIPQRVLIKTAGAAISVDAPVRAKLNATGRIGIVGVSATADDGAGGALTVLARKNTAEPMFKLALTGGADGFATLHDLFSGSAGFGVTPSINAQVPETKVEAVATVGEGAAKTELARGKVTVKWDDLTQPSTFQVAGDADFNKKLFRFDFDRQNPRALLGLVLTTIRDGMDQVNRLARDNEKLARSLPVVGAGYDDMVGTFVKIRDFADQLNTLNQNLTLQGLEEAIEDELVKAFGLTEAQAADLLDLDLDTSQPRTALIVRLRFCQASTTSTACQGTAQPVKGRFALDVPGGGIVGLDATADVQLDYLAQGELALGVELPELVPGTNANPVPTLKTGEQPANAFVRGSTGVSLGVKASFQGQAAATLGPFTVALGQPNDQFAAKAAASYSIGTGGSAAARLSPAAWAQQALNRITTGPFTIHPAAAEKVNCGAPTGTYDACARLPVYFQKGTGSPTKLGQITFTTDDVLAGPFNFAGHQQVLTAFANEALKFSTWIEGLRWLVDRAKQSLDGASVGQQLPLVGKSFAAGAETLAKLNAFLAEVQGLVTEAESAASAGSLRTKITTFLNQKLGSGGLDILRNPVTVTILCGASACVDGALPPQFSDVRLSVPLGQTGKAGTTPFSFGFPGMRIQSASSLNTTASWQLDLVFGADRQGFYLDTGGQELTAGIKVDIPDTLNAEIAFLPLTITDLDPAGDELGVELGFDIKKGDPVTKKLYLNQILREGFSFTNRNDVGFTIKGCADIDLGLELKPDSGLPSLKANLDLLSEWGGCLGSTAPAKDVRDGLAPVTTIKLSDVKFDLGPALTNYMRPAVQQIQRFTQPVQPVIDTVRAPIPVVSNLAWLVGKPAITWWDALKAYIAAQGAMPPTGVFPSQGNSLSAIDTLINLVDFVNRFPQSGSGEIKIADSVILNPGLAVKPPSTPEEAGKLLLQQPVVKDVIADISAKTGFDIKLEMNKVAKGDGGGGFKPKFSFPALEQPVKLVNLLLGQDVDLVHFDAGPLQASTSFDLPYGLPFAKVGVHGSAGITGHLELAYDTYGIRRIFAEKLSLSSLGGLVHGLAILDRDSAGDDVPEIRLDADLHVYANVGIPGISAEGQGGVEGFAEFNLHDLDGDGKIRYEDIANNISNPACLFDSGGVIQAYARVVITGGPFTGTKNIVEPYELLRIPDIQSFCSQALPPNPQPAELQTGGLLVLNMGPRANLRQFAYEANDPSKYKDEHFQLTTLGGGRVGVTAFGVYKEYGSSATPVTKISGDGGDGKDDIVAGPDFGIPLDVSGGTDGDNLAGGAAADKLRGGDGTDVLSGNQGGDELFGENGADILNGDTGNDTLDGGAAGDDLAGGDGTDAASYSTRATPVTLDADDVPDDGEANERDNVHSDIENLTGSGGDDFLSGNAFDNRIDGGGGNDRLLGGAGNDTFIGGNGTDTVEYGDHMEAVTAALFGQGGSAGESDAISGVENLTGGPGDDFLKGNNLANVLDGAGGDDKLRDGDHRFIGGTASDRLIGGPGSDTADYTERENLPLTIKLDGQASTGCCFDEKDTIELSVENATGGLGADTIEGNQLSNVLDGGLGNDTLKGMGGDDVLVGNDNADLLDGGTGTNTADYSDHSFFVQVKLGDAVRDGGQEDWSTDKNARPDNDELVNIKNVRGSAGADALEGDAGANLIDGGKGDDNPLKGGGGEDRVLGGEGDDWLWGDGGDDTVDGDAGRDVLRGGDDNDTLEGGSENDTLEGGANDDILRGGTGEDSVSGEAGDDLLDGGPDNDTLTGGFGKDTVSYAGHSSDLKIPNTGPTGEKDSVDVEVVIGGSGNDEITGFSEIHGGPGADRLTSTGGRLVGGPGADILTGSPSIFVSDTADYSERASSVQVDLSDTGKDGGIEDGAGDTLIDIDDVIGGSGDDTLIGNSSPNRLEGGVGDDVLEGRDGVDFLIAGPGADTIEGGGGRDELSYVGETQPVRVSFDGIRNDGVNGEDNILSISDVVGGSGDDVLIGNDETNFIRGGPGNDLLVGHGARDEFHGDAGNDVMRGGAGNDELAGDSGLDTADYSDHQLGVRVDLTNANPNWHDGGPEDGVGDLVLDVEDVVGGASHDDLQAIRDASGGPGADLVAGTGLLTGGEGDDIIIEVPGGSGLVNGGAGNDVMTIIGALDREVRGGPGNDTVDYSQVLDGLYIDLGAAVIGPGGGKEGALPLLSVENATGGLGNDTIVGTSGSNELSGGPGDDILQGVAIPAEEEGKETEQKLEDGDDLLDGGMGADDLAGGPGVDTLTYAGRTNPVIVKLDDKAGDGHDTDDAPGVGDPVAGDNARSDIENLVGGDGADDLTGNEADNALEGGEGADKLSGGEGHDVLVPSGSSVDGADDVSGGLGTDLVSYEDRFEDLDISFDDTANDGDEKGSAEGDNVHSDVEDALGGAGADTVTGSTEANWLRGGAGDDILAGEEGMDTLEGGAGKDDFNAGDGDDTVRSRDHVGEDVACGNGADTVIADKVDNVDKTNCETGTNAVPEISIADDLTREVSPNASFAVSLSAVTTDTVTVQWATQDGSATEPGDYTSSSGTVTFASGVVFQTVTVPIQNDDIDEDNETFRVQLSAPTNATLDDAEAVGTIEDEEDAPTITVLPGAANEGVAPKFKVSLSSPSKWQIAVQFATEDGTAVEPADYPATADTVTFQPGETSKFVNVPTVDDDLYELDEVFYVAFRNPVNARLGTFVTTGTIRENDALPQISIDSVGAPEDDQTGVVFTVSLSRASSLWAVVDFATSEGTATEPEDFASVSGTLAFGAGQRLKTVVVPIADDALDEADETFTVTLSSSSGAAIGQAQGTGTIQDEDPLPDVSLNDVVVTETDTAGAATVNVKLDTVSGRQASVAFATADRSAAAPGDYTATSGTLIFPAGTTAKTISVPIAGDDEVEVDEDFAVVLSSPSAAAISDSQGLISIRNDDLPKLSIADADVVEGDEGGTAKAAFEVKLSPASADPVKFDYQTMKDTATGGEDYIETNGVVLLNPGETSAAIEVTVNGDDDKEDNETFGIQLGIPENAELKAETAVGTILDDDGPADLGVEMTAEPSELRPARPITFQIRVVNEGPAAVSDATIQLELGGLALLSAGDSCGGTEPVTCTLVPLASGEEALLTVVANADEPGSYSAIVKTAAKNLDENPTNDGATAEATVREPLSGQIAFASDRDGNAEIYSMGPGGESPTNLTKEPGASDTDPTWAPDGTQLAFTSDRAGNPDVWLLDSLGDAIQLTDNPAADRNPSFSPDGRMIAFTSDRRDVTEVWLLDLQTGEERPLRDDIAGSVDPAWSPAGTQIAFVSFRDGQLYLVDVEGESAPTRLTGLAGEVSQPAWSPDGAQIAFRADVGGTADILVVPREGGKTEKLTDDEQADSDPAWAPEGDRLAFETVDTNGSRAVAVLELGGATTLVTERDEGNDSAPDWQTIFDRRASIDDVSVQEGDSGSADATFTVSLSHPSRFPVSVDFATVDGTATAGSDYAAASGTLTFAPGQRTATIAVSVTGDVVEEADETFTVRLSNALNTTLPVSEGTGTIVDDDGPPDISVADMAVAEGGSGTSNALFTVSLSDDHGSAVSVDYTTSDGTAAAPGDYTATSGELTIPAGSESGTIAVPVVGDTLDEPDETFTVTLSAPVNGTLSDAQATGTITDDDAVPTISVGDVSAPEGTSAKFAVSLSVPSGKTISVDFQTADLDALSPDDYAAASGTLTFTPGQTAKEVSVTVQGDALDEPDESFTLALSEPVNVTLGHAEAVGTITDDDAAPTVSVGDDSVVEGTGATTTAEFDVTLSGASGKTVLVDFQTANGTAVSPDDYTASSGTLTFAPGQTSRQVSVTVQGDALDEPDETFTLTLVDPVKGTLSDGQATGTITDDDAEPTLSIGDASAAEGASLVFPVSLSAASAKQITVAVATADGSATSPADFGGGGALATFPAGVTTQSVAVSLVDDAVDEPDETFMASLSTPTNATIADGEAIGTILDGDEPPAGSPESVSAPAPAGGTVSTDSESNGATSTDPLETAVTTPVAGTVSIEETAGAPPETSAYSFLGYQVSITAPAATAADPLIIVFVVDAAQLPGGGAGAVVLFRNGVPLASCSGAGATPDPCVEPPVTLPDGDAKFTVRTSEASLWAFGVAKPQPPPPSPPPAPPGPAADVTPPVLKLAAAARQKLSKALKQGVLASITCSESCTALAELRLSAKTAKRLKLPVVVGKLQVALAQAIAQAVKVRLIAKAKRKFAQLTSVALALRVTATDPAGNASVASKSIKLRR